MNALIKWIQLKYYQYLLTTALYMLEPWERALFNVVALAILAMSVYTTYTYGPANFYWFVGSLLDYFPGLDTVIPGVRISALLPQVEVAEHAATKQG